MTTTRAKFTLQSIERTRHWNGKDEIFNLKFSPVTGTSEENKRFFEASPSGSLQLGTVRAEIAAGMKLGGEYYLDITPAE